MKTSRAALAAPPAPAPDDDPQRNLLELAGRLLRLTGRSKLAEALAKLLELSRGREIEHRWERGFRRIPGTMAEPGFDLHEPTGDVTLILTVRQEP